MEDGRWPDMGTRVLAELRRHPGRVALVQQNKHAELATARLAGIAGQQPLHVGVTLAAHPDALHERDIVELIGAALVLTDIDALFWRPRFGLDVLRLMRVLARHGSSAVFVWPGTITNSELSYSKPGRDDHYCQSLSDAIVLTPLTTNFDDDPPFEIKRIP